MMENSRIVRKNLESAYFAGGCFWGTEYFFQASHGVVSTSVGYMGGSMSNPAYEDVCTGATGHAETIKVVYDSSKTSFEDLAKLFFEIHDPTQVNRQGPDVGEQYRSAIFYVNHNQKEIANNLIKMLKNKGYKVVTQVVEASTFWKAEDYHQNYYMKKGLQPHCHVRIRRF